MLLKKDVQVHDVPLQSADILIKNGKIAKIQLLR